MAYAQRREASGNLMELYLNLTVNVYCLKIQQKDFKFTSIQRRNDKWKICCSSNETKWRIIVAQSNPSYPVKPPSSQDTERKIHTLFVIVNFHLFVLKQRQISSDIIFPSTNTLSVNGYGK